MVKSFFRKFGITGTGIHFKDYDQVISREIGDKVNDALDGVQNYGGSIINSYVTYQSDGGTYLFFLLYEDNGRYQEIDDYLRHEVFGFDKRLEYDDKKVY